MYFYCKLIIFVILVAVVTPTLTASTATTTTATFVVSFQGLDDLRGFFHSRFFLSIVQLGRRHAPLFAAAGLADGGDADEICFRG